MPKNQASKEVLTISGHRPTEAQLDLFPVTEVEVDGIQMGVLSDGSPYLTLRGLARMCGIDHAPLLRLTNNWSEEQSKPRGIKIKELLAVQGHKGDSLYVRTKTKGVETHAYTDAVCMAILEYYAFEATQGSSEIALKNYRLLARYSFRSFIYNRCGYDPDKHIPDSWKNFHERVLMEASALYGLLTGLTPIWSLSLEAARSILTTILLGFPNLPPTQFQLGFIRLKHLVVSAFGFTRSMSLSSFRLTLIIR